MPFPARGEMSISEASKRTRLPADTLRKWSERYAWARAMRHPNGYRFYTQPTILVLMRVAELLRKGWDLGSLLRDGELQLPESKPESEIEIMRAQIADLIVCLRRSPDEYWTAEAMAEREQAVRRATGGRQFLDRLDLLRSEAEQARAALKAERDPSIAEIERMHQLALQQLIKERNEARTEVQELYIRQSEISRRLDTSLRANQQLLEREIPQMTRRLRRAEKRLRELDGSVSQQ